MLLMLRFKGKKSVVFYLPDTHRDAVYLLFLSSLSCISTFWSVCEFCMKIFVSDGCFLSSEKCKHEFERLNVDLLK